MSSPDSGLTIPLGKGLHREWLGNGGSAAAGPSLMMPNGRDVPQRILHRPIDQSRLVLHHPAARFWADAAKQPQHWPPDLRVPADQAGGLPQRPHTTCRAIPSAKGDICCWMGCGPGGHYGSWTYAAPTPTGAGWWLPVSVEAGQTKAGPRDIKRHWEADTPSTDFTRTLIIPTCHVLRF